MPASACLVWVAADARDAGQLEADGLRGALAGTFRVHAEAGALRERDDEAAEAAVHVQRHAVLERELRELRDRVDRPVRKARRAAYYLNSANTGERTWTSARHPDRHHYSSANLIMTIYRYHNRLEFITINCSCLVPAITKH